MTLAGHDFPLEQLLPVGLDDLQCIGQVLRVAPVLDTPDESIEFLQAGEAGKELIGGHLRDPEAHREKTLPSIWLPEIWLPS